MASIKKEKLLIINYIENNTIELKTMFEQEYEVVEANSGRDAVDNLEQCEPENLPAAVVIDGNSFFLGEGWAVIEYRNSKPELANIPIIAIGSLPDDDNGEANYDNEFVTEDEKPAFFAVPYTDKKETVKRTAEIIDEYRSGEYHKKANA